MAKHKTYKGKTGRVEFDIHRIPNDGRPNSFEINVPDQGKIAITGTSEFVAKIFRQLLEHPESLVSAELILAYEALPIREQKRFRKFLKIGEFANPDQVAWPAWLEEKK